MLDTQIRLAHGPPVLHIVFSGLVSSINAYTFYFVISDRYSRPNVLIALFSFLFSIVLFGLSFRKISDGVIVETMCLQWGLNILVLYREYDDLVLWINRPTEDDQLNISIHNDPDYSSYFEIFENAGSRKRRRMIWGCYGVFSGASTIGFAFQIIGTVLGEAQHTSLALVGFLILRASASGWFIPGLFYICLKQRNLKHRDAYPLLLAGLVGLAVFILGLYNLHNLNFPNLALNQIELWTFSSMWSFIFVLNIVQWLFKKIHKPSQSSIEQ